MQSVRIEWLTGTYSIMLFKLDANFTVDDYRKAVAEAWEFLDHQNIQTFYVAADVTSVNRVPAEMITTMFHEYRKTHPAFAGFTIFIGAPHFIKRLVEQFQSIFHTSKFGFVDEIQDVESVISQHMQPH